MARGGRVALQTVLGGLSGGLQGFQQAQARKKSEARQQALDVLNLQEMGYVTPEQYAQQREGAIEQGGTTVSRALMSALSPLAGAQPVAQVTGEDVSALSRALAMPTQPVQRVTLGGQEFVRGETRAEREERLALLAQERQAMTTREAQRMRAEERQAEQEWRSTEAEIQRKFTASQNAMDRQAKSATAQIGEINPVIARNASTLRDDYRAEPTVKNSEIIARQTRIVQAAAKREDPASDLSLIFAYMKVLDPGSVVREREFANAQNAASVPDQVRNLYNRVLRGTRLNPTQRSQFLSSAIDIAQTQRAEMRAQNQRYSAIATRYGVPSDLVIYDPFETLFPETEEANQRMTVPPPVTVPAESTGRGRPDLGRLLQTPTRRP